MVCWTEHNKMLPFQGVIRVLLNTVCMPYLNSRLGNGLILPVVHGFTLQDVYVLTSAEQLTLCSDVTFNASSLASLLWYREVRVWRISFSVEVQHSHICVHYIVHTTQHLVINIVYIQFYQSMNGVHTNSNISVQYLR